jgi:hypothetical protein
MAEFVHNFSINLNNIQLCFHDLLVNLFGTLTSRDYKFKSRPPNFAQEDLLESWDNEDYF